MTEKADAAPVAKKRSPARARQGSTTYSTLVERPVYRVLGQIYTRLLYTGYDPGPAYRGGVIPMTADPIFKKGGIAFDASDYCLKDVELKITQGKKTLANTKSDSLGRFALDADLRANISYNLEAVLSADRIYSEKIVCELKIKDVPGGRDHGPQITKVEVTAKHFLNTSTPQNKVSWELSHQEKLTPVMEIGSPAQLIFDLNGPLIFSTVSLGVGYLSQHPPPDDEFPFLMIPSNEPGESLAVLHQHMCLATCFAMLLQYYGVDKGRDDVVDEAAKVFRKNAKMINGEWIWRPDKGKPGSGYRADLSEKTKQGDKQLKLVPESGATSKEARWPHNVVPLLLLAVQPWLDKAKVGLRSTAAESTSPLVDFSANREIWGMIGSGLPFIVIDKGSRDWDHGRLCHGVVVDDKGKIKTMYGNDPWNNNTWTIKTDGTQSELGWIAWGKVLKQSEVSPERLRSGGDLPAPTRGSLT